MAPSVDCSQLPSTSSSWVASAGCRGSHTASRHWRWYIFPSCRTSCHSCRKYHTGSLYWAYQHQQAALTSSQQTHGTTTMNSRGKPGFNSHCYLLSAGSAVVRIDPLRFLAGCRTRRLIQALSVLSLSHVPHLKEAWRQCFKNFRHSGNALVAINEVALLWARLAVGWVTAFGQVNHFAV